jgi:hypothetical protein
MKQRTMGRFGAAAFAALALTVAACGDDTDSVANDADSIAEEAETRADEAQNELDDLQEDIEGKLDDAGEAVDEGQARAQAELFKQQLTDFGGDDTPSVAVADLESVASDLPQDPEVTGIEDRDDDGLDDDGKVQITVGDSSACVTVSGSSVDVADGTC